MDSLWIAIIILAGGFSISLITCIILAIKQHYHIKDYRLKTTNLKNQIKEHQDYLTQQLHPLSIDYELPEGEKCYQKEAFVNLYVVKNKADYRKNYRYLTAQSFHNSNYHIENLSGYLQLRTRTETPLYSGTLYLTNKRLLLIDQQSKQVKIIWLSEIIYTNPSLFNLNRSYQAGFLVVTAGKIYKIECENVTISMILYRLIKEQEKLEGETS